MSMLKQYLQLDEELSQNIMREADRRLAEGEELDPVGVLAQHLRAKKPVLRAKAEAIWRLHNEGPWSLNRVEFEWFQELCKESGNPYREPTWVTPVECINAQIAIDNFGDCVISAAASGKDVAVWSRKGRLYIGFRNQSDAMTFRAIRPEWSMDITGNRHLSMVVLEGMAPYWEIREPESNREALTGQYCDLNRLLIPELGKQALLDLGSIGIN